MRSTLAILLLLPAVGISCARPDRRAATQREQDAYELGRREARAELERGAPTIWVAGLVPPEGNDPETGLPFKAVASCIIPHGLLAMINGHNDEIRRWLAASAVKISHSTDEQETP